MPRRKQNLFFMHEPVSPELVLVDPDLAARARAALPERVVSHGFRRPPVAPAPAPAAPSVEVHRRYPLWARITTTMWLVVIGILIGGVGIPHAHDTPRIVSAEEIEELCPAP